MQPRNSHIAPADNHRASRMLITKLDPVKTPWSRIASPPFVAHGTSLFLYTGQRSEGQRFVEGESPKESWCLLLLLA